MRGLNSKILVYANDIVDVERITTNLQAHVNFSAVPQVSKDFFTSNNKKLLNTTLSTTDGRLRFIETKTSNPLSLTFIEKCLHEIIPNSSQVQHILHYIKEKREIKINSEIKRYYN